MKRDMRKNSGTKTTERRNSLKNKSIFEILPYRPIEGFNCSGRCFVTIETANRAIKASYP
jgi:hypothetical protein